eukprot:372675-Heterocapsa_arctica.AAC.1
MVPSPSCFSLSWKSAMPSVAMRARRKASDSNAPAIMRRRGAASGKKVLCQKGCAANRSSRTLYKEHTNAHPA